MSAAAALTPGTRGFAVTAGLDPGLATELASACEELGYRSLWSNDHGAADGLETLAALARGADASTLGISGLSLVRRPSAAIADRVIQLGLDPSRLLLGLSPGRGGVPAEAVAALRSALPGVTVLASGPAPADTTLGASADGVLVEWTTPAGIDALRGALGSRTPLLGYVRAAVGADAETRLARDEGFYRGSAAWREHFAGVTGEPGRTGVACDLPAQVPAALAPYAERLDLLIVRGLAATRLPSLERIARAAAPPGGTAAVSPAPAAGSARPAAR